MRYKIVLEYDGGNFYGWQKQSYTTETIQEYVEKGIHLLSGENIEVFASGRTDTGVHALGQTVHFDMKKNISTESIVKGLNHFLRDFFIQKNKNLNKLARTRFMDYYNIDCIAIRSCEIVDETFHARFSTKARHYRYIISNQPEYSTFEFRRVWFVRNKLDIESMVGASKKLLGKHDFTSFRSTECQALSPIKTHDKCDISTEGPRIIFDLSAKSFLHHMVRNIVGTLKEVGLGKKKVDDISNIIAVRDRRMSGAMAPACGLYFVGVDY
jgi:tRNA pseudouridine38-40 synthase